MVESIIPNNITQRGSPARGNGKNGQLGENGYTELASFLGIQQDKAEDYAAGAIFQMRAGEVQAALADCPWFVPGMMRDPHLAELFSRALGEDSNTPIPTLALEVKAYARCAKMTGYAMPGHLSMFLAIVAKQHNRAKFQAKIAEMMTAQARGETEEAIQRILDEAQEYLRPIDLKPEDTRFKLYSAADALKPRPPAVYIIDDLFVSESTALVYGKGGSKKTYSLLDAAVCVALGAPWLGRRTKQSPVLIIDEENGERRLGDRLANVMRAHGADETAPIHYTTLAQFDLRDLGDQAQLKRLIEKTGAKLIIIDSMVDVMPGGDENAAGDVQPLFQGLRRIADQTGSAIVVIHHANKGGDYRGSTAILGAVDTMIAVKSEAGSPNIDFDVQKLRDGKEGKFAAVIHFRDKEEGKVWLSESDAKPDRISFKKGEDYVIGYLREHGQASVKTIADSADTVAPSTARTAVYNLTEMGYLRRTNPGEKDAIYEINPDAKFWNTITIHPGEV